KIVFVLLDPVAQKNLGQMLLTTHLQEQHLFLFFVYLFFVNRLCFLHVRYNLCFFRFAIHNFLLFFFFLYFHFFYFFFFFCFFCSFVLVFVFSFLLIIIFLRSLSVNIFIRSTFSLSLIMKLHALLSSCFHFLHSLNCISHMFIASFLVA